MEVLSFAEKVWSLACVVIEMHGVGRPFSTQGAARLSSVFASEWAAPGRIDDEIAISFLKLFRRRKRCGSTERATS